MTAPTERDPQAEREHAEFTGWFEAQGYPSPEDRYDGDEMSEAFTAGMQAQRDLDAADGPSFTEWALFWGGEDPESSAGLDLYDDEADCEENQQWVIGGGVATRTVTRGPWTVTKAAAPPASRADELTPEELAEFRAWQAAKHAKSEAKS